MPDDKLTSFGYVREVNEEERTVTVVVSTGDVARDNAIISPDGWDLRNYERNPVVLWAHDDRSLPIAKAVRSIVTPDALIQQHQFADHPVAETVWRMVAGGFVNATSVRWRPGETEVRSVGEKKDKRNVLVFTKGHELLETSYVAIPADPGALVIRADGSRLDARDYIAEPEPVEEEPPTEQEPIQDPVAQFLSGFTGKKEGN